MPHAHARLALLLLAALAACAPARAQTLSAKEAPAAVEGRVTDGDEGLPGVYVVLVSFQNGGRFRTVARARTDHEGRYRLTGAQPGRYHVMPAPAAFVLPESEMQIFPPGRALVLAAGETVSDVDFRLTRGAVITGRVTDADGQPVIAEQVQLTPADPSQPQHPTLFMRQQRLLTDDRGVYRAYGLPAGRYRVSVGQDEEGGSLRFGARRHYRRTFHPDAVEESQARVVEVGAGTEATDVDIRLARPTRTYSASGRFLGPDGRPAPGVPVGFGLVDRDGREVRGYGGGVLTDARGEFLLSGLAPGTYAVFALPPGDGGAETYSDAVKFVLSDADVSGIEVRLRRGASVSGVVVVEGMSDRATVARLLSQLRLAGHLQPSNAALAPPNYAHTRIALDGSFRLGGLGPGRLRLGLGGPQPPGVTLARVELNGALQRDGFEVSEGAEISNVRVVISYGTSVVRGQINLSKGVLGPDERLLVFARRLLPAGDPRAGESGRSSQVDARGRFIFEGLPAGDYELSVRSFRRAGPPPANWRQQVSVPEGAEITITLTLDPADQ